MKKGRAGGVVCVSCKGKGAVKSDANTLDRESINDDVA